MVKFHIKGIKTYKSKGKIYHYDRSTGKPIHAPYGTPEFALEVREIRVSGRNERPCILKGSLAALILDFQASIEFEILAPRTQKDYRGYAKDLESVKDLALLTLVAPHIAVIRDQVAKKRTKDRAN